MYDALLKLQLPRIKPRWADLTDAGPGVGVSNFGVRFRGAEIACMFNSDYRIRCHRSRGDSGQGEAERTNSAIGDAVIDGATIEWEHEKLFDGMSNETIEAMSKDFDIYDRERMERNAWIAAQEVNDRIDDAKAPSGYITSYIAKPDHMLFNQAVLTPKASPIQVEPGFYYQQKIAEFISLHYKVGELFMEYLKGSCREKLEGNLCSYCQNHPFLGQAAMRIPQPVPDLNNPGHYLSVFDTPTVDSEGKPRQVDDFLPRAQIKIRFHGGQLLVDDDDVVSAFGHAFL